MRTLLNHCLASRGGGERVDFGRHVLGTLRRSDNKFHMQSPGGGRIGLRGDFKGSFERIPSGTRSHFSSSSTEEQSVVPQPALLRGGLRASMQMKDREFHAIRNAATACLRYEFNSEMVSLDMLYAKIRYHWCTREMLEQFFRKCCSLETEEHRFQTEIRGGDLYVRCIPSKKRQRGTSQATGDKRRDFRKAPWHQKDKEEPSGSAADAPTFFDEKAAHATAVAAEAVAVAEAVVKLAKDLKETANNDENWRRKHFQELIKQWHPDKNLEQTKMSNAVFQYLMEMRAEYLTVGGAASSSTSRYPWQNPNQGC